MKFGVVGLGGFGRAVCHAILQQGPLGEVPSQLTWAYDPAPDHTKLQPLHEAGVHFADSIEQLLASDVDIVWLPLPIQLHRPYAERVLASGKAVMCEKPAAGTLEDVDAMSAAATRAGRPLAIGFQDMYEASTHEIKRLLCAGEIGEVQSVVVAGSWPRSNVYYGRGNWPGRIKVDGAWVLDSPANNALAHFVNLALFWLGKTPDAMAELADVQGELYRAHQIENFDTCAFRARTRAGTTLLGYLTHVGAKLEHPTITVRGTRGRVVWRLGLPTTIETGTGSRTIDVLPAPAWRQIGSFAQYVATGGAKGYAFTPQMARVHTQLIWALAQGGPAQVFGPSMVRAYTGRDEERFLAVDGLNELLTACAARECLPSESGLAPWARANPVVTV